MPEFITDGALMQCDKGVTPSKLTVTSQQGCMIAGKAQATIKDKAPNANIPPFGVCAVTQKSCMPQPTAWLKAGPYTIDGVQELTTDSFCMCGLGGKIQFLQSGNSGFVKLVYPKDTEATEQEQNSAGGGGGEDKELGGGYYNTKGEKIGNSEDDTKIYLVYRRSDIKKIQENKEVKVVTKLSDLKDAILIPKQNVRDEIKKMIDRSNSANDKRTDEFKGDDDIGGFHEEGGYFTEDKIVVAKPGPKTDPSWSSAQLQPFDPAKEEDRRLIGVALGTVHIHPKKGNADYEFTQDPSIPGDLDALRIVKQKGWMKKDGYGIVIGAQANKVSFYDENGTKTYIRGFNVFMNLGSM